VPDYSHCRYGEHVSRSSQIPTAAELELPSWLGGGNPSGFLKESGLIAKRIGASKTRWRVTNRIPWEQGRPILITVDDIAGPSRLRPRFDLVSLMAHTEESAGSIPDEVAHRVTEMAELAKTTKSPVDLFAWMQMITMLITGADLQRQIVYNYETIKEIGTESNSGDKIFTHAGVHVIRRAPELLHRIKMASVSLQLASDSSFAEKTLEQIQRDANASGESVFSSSEGLYDGIYTLAPLFGSLVPAIWAFTVTRMLGVIIYSLGQPLAGSRGNAAELLHLLPSQGPIQSSSIPSLSPTASSKAIRWWIGRLNGLFAVLSDITVFTDENDVYVPARHLHAQLTLDQLFRRVYSMEIALRDSQARRVLFFTILDTLERLTAHNVETLCNLSHATSTLSRLRSIIPDDAAEILLPGAERGIDALRQLQKGFFIGRRIGVTEVRWNDPNVGPQSMGLEKAVAHYIRLLRDATHGHGTKFAKRAQRTDALLTNHNGNIPHDLGWLGYLYLLDVLARPDDLRQRLHG
jgi:hypothetical protein